MNVKRCAGCYNDHYNRAGNSSQGKCWMLDKATLEKRYAVHINTPPPYTDRLIREVPSCYRQSQMAFIPLNHIGKDGYWK